MHAAQGAVDGRQVGDGRVVPPRGSEPPCRIWLSQPSLDLCPHRPVKAMRQHPLIATAKVRRLSPTLVDRHPARQRLGPHGAAAVATAEKTGAQERRLPGVAIAGGALLVALEAPLHGGERDIM